MRHAPHRVRLVIVAAGCAILAFRAAAADLKSWRLLSDSPPFPPTIGVPMSVYDPVRHRVLAVSVDLPPAPAVVHVFEPAPDPHWSALATAGQAPVVPYLSSLV